MCWIVDWFALALIVTASGVVLGVSGLICRCDCDLRGVGIIYVSGCFGVVLGWWVFGCGCWVLWGLDDCKLVRGFGFWLDDSAWVVCVPCNF